MKELTAYIFIPSSIFQVFIIRDVRQADKLNTFSAPFAIIKATFISVDKILFKSILYNSFTGRQEIVRFQFISAQLYPFIAVQILYIFTIYLHDQII